MYSITLDHKKKKKKLVIIFNNQGLNLDSSLNLI